MNNTQRAKLDTCNRVLAYTIKYANELSTIKEFEPEKENFTQALGTINNAAQVQSRPAGTSGDAVTSAKDTMAGITIKYALRAQVKAKQAGNSTLANQLNHPVTYILYAAKNDAIHRANTIKDLLKNNLNILTNVTQNDIIEIEKSIAQYDAIKDNPTIDKQNKAATGTNPLPEAFTAAFAAIENMYDLINSYFADTNPAMVDEFALAKQIINTGIRHTGVTGTISKNGTPLAGAIVTIVGTTKSDITDEFGEYTIARTKSGDCIVEATTPDGEKASKNIHINKGNFETVNFKW